MLCQLGHASTGASREAAAVLVNHPVHQDGAYNLAQCYERLNRSTTRPTPTRRTSKASPTRADRKQRADAHRQPARARQGRGGGTGGAGSRREGEGGLQDHRRLPRGAAAAGARRALGRLWAGRAGGGGRGDGNRLRGAGHRRPPTT